MRKCGTNGFLTLLYAFLQCHPYTGPWKLSPIEVWLSSSIKAMFAIELWCYTFPRLYPHPACLVSYECTTARAWVMAPKCLFFQSKITVFVGHVEVTLRPIQLLLWLISLFFVSLSFFLPLSILIAKLSAVFHRPYHFVCLKAHSRKVRETWKKRAQRKMTEHRSSTKLFL